MQNDLLVGVGNSEILIGESILGLDRFDVVLDKINVRAIVFDDNEKIAILSLELTSIMEDVVAEFKSIVSKVSNIPEQNIWICATHSFNSPHFIGKHRWANTSAEMLQKNSQYKKNIITAIKRATQMALEDMEPARLTLYKGKQTVSARRDIKSKEGWWIGIDHKSPVNDCLHILKVDSANKTKALVVSAAFQSSAMDGVVDQNNLRPVTSDICGRACALVEDKLQTTCMFLVGECGDQVPKKRAKYYMVDDAKNLKLVDNGLKAGKAIINELGHEFFQNICNTLKNEPEDLNDCSIKISSQIIRCPEQAKPFEGFPEPSINVHAPVIGDKNTIVSYVCFGDKVMLVGFMPEINLVTATNIRQASEYDVTILVQMVNGAQKYMADKASFEKCTYESMNSFFAKGAAEKFEDSVSLKLQKSKNIDWSAKNEVFIQNSDGSILPMSEPYYECEEVVPGVFKILSSGDYHYLVRGSKEAIAIDSGYGAGNLREYLQSLVDVPVKNIINTHHHFDHTANNGYFETAYMHKNAIPLATVPFKSFDGVKFITDYKRVAVVDSDVIDIGDKQLQIFEIGDHTPDGIAILDASDKVLFIGDELMRYGKDLEILSVEQFYNRLCKINAYRKDFDYVCAGGGIFDASFFDDYLSCAKFILDGNKGTPYTLNKPIFKPMYTKEGKTLYDRKKPHPGDGGAAKNSCDKKRFLQNHREKQISYTKAK